MYGFNSFYFHFLIVYICYGFVINRLAQNLRRTLHYNTITTRGFQVFSFWFPLFILSAFRGYSVGGDLENYIPQFEHIARLRSIDDLKSLWDQSFREPGYLILSFLIGKISNSPRIFLIITSFISLIGPALLIFRYSTNILLSFYLYYSFGFYTNSFNNIRQAIALSICFFAFHALIRRDLKRFLLIVILASSFHYSAIFFLIVFPFINIRLNYKKIITIFLCGLIAFYFCRFSIMSTLLNVMSFKYDSELISNAENKGWSLFVLYSLILFCEMYLAHNFKKYVNQRYITLILTFQLLCCLFQMYASLFPSMMRLTQYFFVPIIIFIPILIKNFVRYKYIILWSSIVLSLVFCKMTYSFLEATNSNSQGVIPYFFNNILFY